MVGQVIIELVGQVIIERFLIECRKTKTKVITAANQNKGKYITSQTFLATRLSPVDPAASLDKLSNLAVGRLVGLQHSSVIIYLVVIVFGQIRRQFLRECVIILKCENSFIVRF